MGITSPGGSSDGADHDDLATAMDGDATSDGGQPPALADYDPLPEEQSDPPVLLDEADDRRGSGAPGSEGHGGDEDPLEDPSPS